MNSRARQLVGGLAAVGVTLLIVWLSQIPYAAGRGDQALIRLSWRAHGARVLECRPLTADERRELPRHMQQTEVCERSISPYELSVKLDGEIVAVDTIRGSGARGDRPLYVYRELPVSAGSRQLAIGFERLGERDEPPADPGTTEQATPTKLILDEQLNLQAGEVALVTIDSETRRLVVRRSGRSPSRP